MKKWIKIAVVAALIFVGIPIYSLSTGFSDAVVWICLGAILSAIFISVVYIISRCFSDSATT